MATFPLPPTDWVVMSQEYQQMFTMMQIPLVVLCAAFCIWGAVKHKSLVPIWLFLGGGIAYINEPFLNAVGLCWYPPEGMVSVFESIGRPVPLFGFLAYVWFFGGGCFLVYHLMSKGMTTAKIWRLYAILVVAETLLEIPGLNMEHVYTYYGNQPFVLFKFPVWWAFVNAGTPMVTGALVYKILPYIKTVFRPVTIYAVSLSNTMVMYGAGLPVVFTLNTDAGLLATHIAGAFTISLACFFIYVVTLLVATDSRSASSGNSQSGAPA